MTPPPFSVVRLKPKMDPRRIRFGHPWVFANELVLDRRTKALEPGTIALLEGSDREPLALVGFNSASKIVGRVLSRDTDMVIDEAWLGAKIDAALALRERL